MKVKPIPEGFHTITPYFSVRGAARFIEFLKQAFDAKDTYLVVARFGRPRGSALRSQPR